MPNGKIHSEEDPRDAERLKALGEARARGSIEGEKKAIAELIGGWKGKAERWLIFKNVGSQHREEIIARWACGLVKVLKERHEFPHPFGAIAMKRISWARSEYFRESHRKHEKSSENPVGGGQVGLTEADPTLDHLVLSDALAALPTRDREILETTFFSDLPAAEAGKRLGLSEGALRTAKLRALERLRSELAQVGVTKRG